jgi:pimeloyl-ACP methyl ester carboxylesterase
MKIETKKIVIFLPGLVCDQAFWAEPMKALSEGANCICAEWTGEDSLPAMAQKALALVKGPFALAGHSMGGRVALEVFRTAPERVSRIALLNTGYQPLAGGTAGEDEKRGRYALLKLAKEQGMRAMARQWLPPMIHPNRREEAPLVNAIVEMFARKTPEIFEAQIHALLGRPDASSVLEQIRCPALVLTGQEDAWSPPARHAEIAARIRESSLVVIPNCGHMCAMERPSAVTEALRAWLAD